MVADQTLDPLTAHQVRDEGTYVATLGDVTGVAEAAHQLGPGLCGPTQVPADLDRLAREAVARQGGKHEVEGILDPTAVRGRVRQ